jgi:hypothetical protein
MPRQAEFILARALIAILLSTSSVFAQVSALKGDGVTDDTVALSNAIATTCAKGGSLWLPPPSVAYKVTRTLPTPGPQCMGLHVIGGNSAGRQQLDQFSFAPMVPIQMDAQFAGPIFELTSYITLENLDIKGYNQAVYIRDTIDVSFRNVCMSAIGNTGMRDNTPLKITNSFWMWFKGGCLMINGSGTTPIVIMSGEESMNGEAPLDGLITIEDVVAAGGGMKYIQRVTQWGTAGNLVFRNITIEDIQTDILSMTTENGARFGEFEAITFDHVTTTDGVPVAVLSTHDPSLTVKGLFLNQSTGQSSVKVRGNVLGFFDTNGTFDYMSGNSITLGNVTIDSSGITFGTTKLGLAPNGVLSVMVPLYQPPSNIRVAPSTQPGLLTGTHSYFVVAVDGVDAAQYSAFSPVVEITLSQSGSATITWTPSPSNPGGYYIVRDGQYQSFYVPGAGSNSFIDIGGTSCCWGERPNTPSLVIQPAATQK